MRLRILLLLLAVLVVLGGVVAWWLTRGPDPSQFDAIREPRLTKLPDQRMLVVEAAGDPNIVGGAAFKQLFEAYYKLDGVSRASRPPAPRARWAVSLGTPKDQWIGQYALPVPDAVTAPPASAGPLRTTVATWAYGDVAELLHVGSYSSEQPNIEKLHAFVASQGYRVIGEHEEEYVKGPGMIFAGNPASYLTIIRLRVAR